MATQGPTAAQVLAVLTAGDSEAAFKTEGACGINHQVVARLAGGAPRGSEAARTIVDMGGAGRAELWDTH